MAYQAEDMKEEQVVEVMEEQKEVMMVAVAK